VGEGGLLLTDDGPVLRGDAVAFAEVSFEPFKKISPTAGPDDEHVSAIVLVSFTAQIAECSESVQGARHDGFGDPEDLRETAHRVRAGREIDQHEQAHLAIG